MIDHLDQNGALTKREYAFVSQMNECCLALARGKTREAAIAEIAEKFGIEVGDAEKLIEKSEEFMALDVLNNAQQAKELYHHRLTEIYALCMEHGVVDQIETTTKPTKLEVTIREEGGETIRERQFTNAQITKIKPNALNPGAIALALKAAREMAHITGGRPRDPRIGTQNNTLVIGNMPNAQETHRLSDEALAASIGLEIIEAEVVEKQDGGGQPVLPQSAEDSGQRRDAEDAGPDSGAPPEAEGPSE